MNTMTVRPSVRFDIFKRDAFTCAYCGRKPPEVTLELDHIIPIAEGGTDDPENLTTACCDCNRGKGATPLDTEPSSIPDLAARTELIREREAQLRAYHEALMERGKRQDAQFERVWKAWFQTWDATELSRSATPWESTLRNYIDLLGPDAVIEAMWITKEKLSWPGANSVRYFIGVLKRKLAAAEGRTKKCRICGGWLTLEPDQDRTLDYHHAGCPDG